MIGIGRGRTRKRRGRRRSSIMLTVVLIGIGIILIVQFALWWRIGATKSQSTADLKSLRDTVVSMETSAANAQTALIEAIQNETNSVREEVLAELRAQDERRESGNRRVSDAISAIGAAVDMLPRPAPPINFEPEEWALGQLGNPMIRFSRPPERVSLSVDGEGGLAPVPVPSLLHSQLSSLVQSVPGLVSAVQDVTRLRVIFTPETTAQLHQHTLGLVQSGKDWLPLAVDPSSGTFVEMGRLVTGFNPAAITSAAWQIATVITTQHHLANIDTQLRGIRSELDSIREFLYSKEIGVLAGHQAYLDQIQAFISTGSVRMSDAALYRHKIEDVEISSLGIGRAALLRLSGVEGELRSRPMFTERAGDKTEYQNIANSFQKECGIVVGALYVRTMAAHTAGLLDPGSSSFNYRLDDAASQLRDLQQTCEEFANDMSRKAPLGGTAASWLRDACRPFISWFGDDASANRSELPNQVVMRLSAGLDSKIRHLEEIQAALLAPKSTESIVLDVNYNALTSEAIDAQFVIESGDAISLAFPAHRSLP
jgi:hypothetical protein